MNTNENVTKWVGVVFMDGDAYDEISDMGIQEMAEHLAQWDYGTETDDAHTRDEQPWGSSDREYAVTVDGLDYVLAINHPLGYASLNRHPFDMEWN
jgi:hypothetical protein